nr:factor of dna methylation 3 [Quercus suber]
MDGLGPMDLIKPFMSIGGKKGEEGNAFNPTSSATFMEKSVSALLEDQVREETNLHARIIELEKNLDNAKQRLGMGEDQMERFLKSTFRFAEDKGKEKVKFQSRVSKLKKKLEAFRQVSGSAEEVDKEIKEKMQATELAMAEMESLNQNLIAKERKSNDELREVCKKLMDKEEDLEQMEATIQSLIVKERASNDELQGVRGELINGLEEFGSSDFIGIKRMGDLELKPFYRAAKRKYYDLEAGEKAAELCSIWEDCLRDSSWHPFKIVMGKEGNYVNIINEDNEKLKGLKDEYGDELYEAVTTALTEMNEHNPSGGYLLSELWNYNEGRKASLKEVVSYMLKHWEKPKQKRNRRSVRELRKKGN